MEAPLKAASHLRYNNKHSHPTHPSLIHPHHLVEHNPSTVVVTHHHRNNLNSKQSRNRFNVYNHLPS